MHRPAMSGQHPAAGLCCSRLLWALALAMALITGVSSVRAQEGCRRCALDARARVATREGRLADADRLLSESLKLEPRAATAYNLALVKKSRGELMAAKSLFERLLVDEYGTLNDERRAAVIVRLAEVGESLATLIVTITEGSESVIRVDDVWAGVATPGEELRLQADPGTHSVRASSRDGVRRAARVELVTGEEEHVRFRMVNAVASEGVSSTAAATRVDPPSRSSRHGRSP